MNRFASPCGLSGCHRLAARFHAALIAEWSAPGSRSRIESALDTCCCSRTGRIPRCGQQPSSPWTTRPPSFALQPILTHDLGKYSLVLSLNRCIGPASWFAKVRNRLERGLTSTAVRFKAARQSACRCRGLGLGPSLPTPAPACNPPDPNHAPARRGVTPVIAWSLKRRWTPASSRNAVIATLELSPPVVKSVSPRETLRMWGRADAMAVSDRRRLHRVDPVGVGLVDLRDVVHHRVAASSAADRVGVGSPSRLSSSLVCDVSALPSVLGHGGPPASFYRPRRRPGRMRL
jgi:hypothetical protein